jgi:PEGA domain
MKKITLFLFLMICLSAVVPSVGAAGINQGWIQVFCNVDGASVFFDGNYQGLILDGQLLVPVYMAIPVHAFRVEKDGFTTAAGTLTMPDPGATTTAYATIRPISTPTPVPSSMYGSMSVNTSPQGAKIYLDGYYRGISPFAFEGIKPGSHTIDAVLDGYYRYTTMIGISAGSTTDVYFTLEAISSTPNSLNITSDPTHAFVYIHKVYIGKTPLTFNDVSMGNHEIELITPGYEAWSTSAYFPGGGSTRSVSATMISLQPSSNTTAVTGSLTTVTMVTVPQTPTQTATKAGAGPLAVIGALGIFGLVTGIRNRKK